MAPTVGFAVQWLPKDFTEASQLGGVYTIVAYVVMVVVFFCELGSFMTTSQTSMVMLDKRDSDLLQVNFDIDLYDIECQNVRVICITETSDEPLKVSQDFWLRSIDSKGRTFGMATKVQEDPDESDSDLEAVKRRVTQEDGQAELDADWSSSHDGFKHNSFEHVVQAHDFTFINFFAGWCSHCRKFSPLWGEIAAEVNGDPNSDPVKEPMSFADRDGQTRHVRLIRLNCVDFKDLCTQKGVDAYPTIRLYKADGSFSLFEGKREKSEILRWIERTVKMKSYGWAAHHEAFERGCNAKGRIQVPRVPGHLELMAGGGHQNLNPSMTNVSHLVKHFSFSDPEDGQLHRQRWSLLPPEALSRVSPLDGRAFVTRNFHEAYIHDVKVVSTVNNKGHTTYQFAHQYRLSKLNASMVPQAQFHFDIEPFSIYVKRDSKKWYEFVTSLMAILGGIYAIMRLASTASLAASSLLRIGLPQHSQRRGGALNVGHLG
mmetsp:Transcript_114474/g.323677  ORF Transcript_114474/g.323677 Transcript_114474/m.323677 type:complete len:487 (-) Transcript_114474:65-1525(-)